MQAISEVIHKQENKYSYSNYSNYSPIVVNKINTIVNPIVTIVEVNDKKVVDEMLKVCGSLVDPNYKQWFAKRFYHIDPDSLLRAVSLTKQDAINQQRFFTSLIRKAFVNQKAPSDF